MNHSPLFRTFKPCPRQTILYSLPLLILSSCTMASAQVVSIPAGVPFRVEIDHRYPMKVGERIEGHLIAPVYLVDHEVLPASTPVSGFIVSTHPVDRGVRNDALLNGDFTPLVVPEIRFDRLTLPDAKGVATIDTHVVRRDASVVRMQSTGKRTSIKEQVREQIRQRKQDALDTIKKPGKGDLIRRFVYGQLPYHPQEIWAGTQYDAELIQPLAIPQGETPSPLPMQALGEHTPTGTVEARLAQDLNSATTKQGSVVYAILTKPLLNSTKKEVVLPEGTHLNGLVMQAKPARWFARNGKLRFSFRSIDLPAGVQQSTTDHTVHGLMSAAEATPGENISVDSEGGAKAGGEKNKYFAPLALGVLAAASMGGDEASDPFKNGVVSGGFGLLARVVTAAASSRGAAEGFAYYALTKSLYKRWVAKGHEVSFPKNTRLEVELAGR